jgi:hypothetical protein
VSFILKHHFMALVAKTAIPSGWLRRMFPDMTMSVFFGFEDGGGPYFSIIFINTSVPILDGCDIEKSSPPGGYFPAYPYNVASAGSS